MSSKTEKIIIDYDDFQPVEAGGKFQGLGNLLRTEISRWRHSLSWWLQIFAILIFANGITFVAVLGSGGDKSIGLMMFPLMSGMYVGLSAMTMVMGAIVKEKEEGTAAWVLSKPVTRVAFMSSKFITNCISMTLSLVFIPWIVAFFEFSLLGIPNISLAGTFLTMGVYWAWSMFWLTLALMLGSILSSRRSVMYVMITVFFSLIFGGSYLPWQITPVSFWPETSPNVPPSEDIIRNSIISDYVTGIIYPIFGPTILIIISALFLVIAFNRFSKEEL